MIRVLLFLALVALVALGAVWIADRPGDIAITWQGWRIETSVMVAAVTLGGIVVVAILLWSVVRTVLRSPDLIAMFLSHRRGVRGYLAISRGLIAVGAGDARSARRAADEAERIAPGEPLSLLLNAQCAQLSGDRAAAELAFRAMAERDDTKLLGLRGLFVEAQRRNDMDAAVVFAEEAAKAAPSLAWAGQAVLEFRCAAGDWSGALAALDRNSRNRLVDRTAYRRQRAVLLTAQAIAAEAEDGSRDSARALALEAVKYDPTLVPAAELAGRLLGEGGELRRASRIVEKAWQANPHPDLADTYAHLRPGDSARERLTRVQMLAQKTPGHVESALAVARAAIDAQEFAAARSALKPLLKEPTQRVAVLMAEIEERERGDEGRAREWMARALRAPRDPAWTTDGIVSDRWLPATSDGRLDRFQWKVPLAELGEPRDVIEAVEAEFAEPPPVEIAALPAADAGAERAADAAPAPAPEPVAQPVEKPVETPAAGPVSEPSPERPAASPPARPASPPKRVDTVIPLMHAPDDPGPDPAPDREPQPEPSDASRGLRLFK